MRYSFVWLVRFLFGSICVCVCLTVWLWLVLLQVKSCPCSEFGNLSHLGEKQLYFLSPVCITCTATSRTLHSTMKTLFLGFVTTFQRVEMFFGSSLHFHIHNMRLFLSRFQTFSIERTRAFCLVFDTDIICRSRAESNTNKLRARCSPTPKLFIIHFPPSPIWLLSLSRTLALT